MKLILLPLAWWVSLAVCQEAPYAPSGWRPDGPRFEFPEKQTQSGNSYQQSSTSYQQPGTSYQQPGTSYQQPDTSYPQPGTSYQQPTERSQPSDEPGETNLTVQGLPPRTAPVIFRTVGQLRYPVQAQIQFPQEVQQRSNQQLVRTDFGAQRANFELARGTQGLPVQQDPTPLFVVTPLNGQQYSGASFNADLRAMEQQLREQETQKQRYANADGLQRSNSNPDEYNIQFQFGQSPRTEGFNNNFKQDTDDFETGTGTERNIANSNSNDKKNRPKSVTTVETDKSQNYELVESDLPVGYANQLAQLALQQQLAQIQPQAAFPQFGQLQQVMPAAQFGQLQEENQAFQQQIGQLQLPIIYQPFTPAQRLTQQPISRQIQNFYPANFAPLQRLVFSNARQNLEAKAADDSGNNKNELGLNKTKDLNPSARDSGTFEGEEQQTKNQQSFSSQANFQNAQDPQSAFSFQQENYDDDNDFDNQSVAGGSGDRSPPNSFRRYGVPENTDAEQRTVDDSDTATERKRKSSKLRSRRIRPLYTVDQSGLIVQLQ